MFHYVYIQKYSIACIHYSVVVVFSVRPPVVNCIFQIRKLPKLMREGGSLFITVLQALDCFIRVS